MEVVKACVYLYPRKTKIYFKTWSKRFSWSGGEKGRRTGQRSKRCRWSVRIHLAI